MKFNLIFSFLFIINYLSALSLSDGEAFFNNKQFAKAKAVYENLLIKKPNDGLYNYRYARCCYELKDVEKAIIHFEMAGTKFPLRDLYLGELYFKTYRFDQSVMAYQSYLSTLIPTDKMIPEYQKLIEQGMQAAQLIKKVQDITIVDSLQIEKSYLLRFYKFSSELGTLNHEILKLKNRKSADKITYSTQRKDRIIFSDTINSQLDIFTAYKLLDGFSPAVSISEIINTPANESYPFLLLDGITMYFGSDGLNSIGGYDMFITRFMPSSNNYLTPENIGMPFNSPFNDYMMVIDEQKNIGWFATDRYQPAGKVMIYCFLYSENKKIVSQEDSELLRKIAQLKVYRKDVFTLSSNTISEKLPLNELDKRIEFVINDSITYTHISQFKSKEALTLWEEFHKVENDFQNKQNKLNQLRNDYQNTEIEVEKSSIEKEILELEAIIIDFQLKINKSKIIITNLENKYLQNTLLN